MPGLSGPGIVDCHDGRHAERRGGGDDGRANSVGTGELYSIPRTPAREAGCLADTALNVRFTDRRWIEPDLTILRRPVRNLTWVPAELVLMPVEFVSRSSVRADRIDKPRLCADAGVPDFLRVDLSDHDAHVELVRLADDGAHVTQAEAHAGEKFRTELPFPVSFDPADLLEPGESATLGMSRPGLRRRRSS